MILNFNLINFQGLHLKYPYRCAHKKYSVTSSIQKDRYRVMASVSRFLRQSLYHFTYFVLGEEVNKINNFVNAILDFDSVWTCR